MLQLNPTISVKTPKGDAEAIIIIDYGVNVNSVWLCRMKGGKVLHFYSDDILMYDNPMNGKGWDIEDKLHSIKRINPQAIICRHCKKQKKAYETLERNGKYYCLDCYNKGII